MRVIERIIFFYDGNCGLCSRFVQIIHDLDKDKKIYFAPIGGKFFRDMENLLMHKSQSDKTRLANLQSLVALEQAAFYVDGVLFYGPEAVLQALAEASIYARPMVRLALVLTPKILLKWLYRFVAVNRVFVSKLTGSCSLPPASLRFRPLEQ